MLDPEHVFKINLIEVLLEDAELQCPPGCSVAPPPEDEVLDWSEDRIRAYFAQQLAAMSLGPPPPSARAPAPAPAASLPSELPCDCEVAAVLLPVRAISADGGPGSAAMAPCPSAPAEPVVAATTAATAAAAAAAAAATAEVASVQANESLEDPPAASVPATQPPHRGHNGAGHTDGSRDDGSSTLPHTSSCCIGSTSRGDAAGAATAAAGEAERASTAATDACGGGGGSSSGLQLLSEEERQQLFQRWFPGLQASGTATRAPRLRLLAFHSSGNAEDMWTAEGTGARRAKSPLLEWCRREGVELLAAQLPGRAGRLREPFLETAQEFARQLLPVLAPLLAQRHVPYAVVSHSLGCWLAFELLRAVRAAGLPRPAAWCLSAMPAPDLPLQERPWRQQHALGTADFQAEVRGWDVNEVVFTPDMWEMYEPILRADFKLFDEYQLQTGDQPGGAGAGGVAGMAPFEDLPITAFHGTRDRRVTPALVAGWRRLTTGPFRLLPVAGNHLWPLNDRQAKAAWLDQVVAALQRAAGLQVGDVAGAGDCDGWHGTGGSVTAGT